MQVRVDIIVHFFSIKLFVNKKEKKRKQTVPSNCRNESNMSRNTVEVFIERLDRCDFEI